MKLEIKRDKLIMQTTTRLQAVAGEPSDDGEALKFPILTPINGKDIPLTDISLKFETKGTEVFGNVFVTYYDSPDGVPKTHPLGQFKANAEQILLNNGIAKTNEDNQVLSPEIIPLSPADTPANISSEIVVEPSEETVLPSVAAKLKKNSQNTQEI